MSDGVPTEDASGSLILRVRYILYARDASWPIVDLCPLSKLKDSYLHVISCIHVGSLLQCQSTQGWWFLLWVNLVIFSSTAWPHSTSVHACKTFIIQSNMIVMFWFCCFCTHTAECWPCAQTWWSLFLSSTVFGTCVSSLMAASWSLQQEAGCWCMMPMTAQWSSPWRATRRQFSVWHMPKMGNGLPQVQLTRVSSSGQINLREFWNTRKL